MWSRLVGIAWMTLCQARISRNYRCVVFVHFSCPWHLTNTTLSEFLDENDSILSECNYQGVLPSQHIRYLVLSFFWRFSIDYTYHIDSEFADRQHACCARADYQVCLSGLHIFFRHNYLILPSNISPHRQNEKASRQSSLESVLNRIAAENKEA